MKITLILTTTIFTHNVEFNRQKKYEERKNQYILKIKKWLNQTKFNIVVVENSDIILMSYLTIIIALKKLFQKI